MINMLLLVGWSESRVCLKELWMFMLIIFEAQIDNPSNAADLPIFVVY